MMNLQEATVKALQEDKAIANELHQYIVAYRNTLRYLDNLANVINGEADAGGYSFSDIYFDAEEDFMDKLMNEYDRVEKLLKKAEEDLLRG